MSNLSIEKTLQNVLFLEKTLQHPVSNVQVIGLNEVSRIVRHSPGGIKDINIVIRLIECLKSKEVGVALPCIPLLVKTLPGFIDVTTIHNRLLETLKLDVAVKCRTYEVAVKLAKISPEMLEKIDFILEKAVNDLDHTDVLFQLNVMEILSELPEAQHGLVYLENKGVFLKLLKKVEHINENPLSNFLIPGLMKFFGSIGTFHPGKVFNDYSQVVISLFDSLSTVDFTMLPSGLDTLGILGRSNEGKKYLENTFGDRTKKILGDFGANTHNLPTDLKLRVLDCLSNLFYINPEESDNQVTCITESWYAALSPNNESLEFVFSFAQNPFPDIKGMAFILLKSISQHKWGHQRLLRTGGFIEFLLDRTTEFDKDLVQEKYEIVKKLSESNVFPASILVQLKKYVEEGAFYVRGIVEVAVEGAS